MGYQVMITGSTGMVGKGVLMECLDHPDISKVILVNRRPIDIGHPKIQEVILKDFQDLAPIDQEIPAVDACYHCMGISALGKTEEEYTAVTYHVSMNLARMLLAKNSAMIFCYVSGQGTDIKGSMMWARVKGRTEKELTELPFKKVVLFRPGFIQPLRGIQSSTGWYNTIYKVTKPIYPALKNLFPNAITNTDAVGRAMINCLKTDAHPQILDNRDINKLADEIV
jgi:uncharacterized protein YbjT (DUF2867 family)